MSDPFGPIEPVEEFDSELTIGDGSEDMIYRRPLAGREPYTVTGQSVEPDQHLDPLTQIGESIQHVPMTQEDQVRFAKVLRQRMTQPITEGTLEQDLSISHAQGYVMSFMKYAGQTVRVVPSLDLSPQEIVRMRKVLEEEIRETLDAVEAGDLVETVDGICDSIYVLLSLACSIGVYIAPFMREVCENNNTKTYFPATHSPEGKLLKPEGHIPPRIGEMLVLLAELEGSLSGGSDGSDGSDGSEGGDHA